MKANLGIIKNSSSFTLQDIGRNNYPGYGVPRAGCVDRKAAIQLNKILGNNKDETIIEWSLIGPKFHFPKSTFIAVSHSSSQTLLNGKAIRANEKIFVKADSILNLGYNPNIMYQYLAIKDGFKSKKMLDSASSLNMYHEISQFSIKYKVLNNPDFEMGRPSFVIPRIKSDNLVSIIDCYPGPEFDKLSGDEASSLTNYFTISSSRNRMGMQLNERIANKLPSMLSTPVIPGTVQLTPGGKLIVLGRDCQTTGGYPRILWLPDSSMAKLYQKPSEVKFRFEIHKYR